MDKCYEHVTDDKRNKFRTEGKDSLIYNRSRFEKRQSTDFSFLFASRFDGGRQVPCGPLPERKCFFLIIIIGTDGLYSGSLASTLILIIMSMPAKTTNADNFIQSLFEPESQRNGMFMIC